MRYAIVCSLVLALSFPASAQERLSDPLRESVRTALRENLRDPASAQFRWLPRVDGEILYCGFVNAKNAFGGYTGFVPYLAILPGEDAQSGHVTIFEIGSGDADGFSNRFILTQCAEVGFDMSATGEQEL